MLVTGQTTQKNGAPSEGTQKALVGAFIAIQADNLAIKTQGQVTEVKVKGLEDVNAKLLIAQGHAKNYKKNIEANIQNQLQHIIDYNTTYSALASSINDAIATIGKGTKANPPSVSTMQNLAAELTALQSQVQGILYGSGGTKDNPSPDSTMGVYNQLLTYQNEVTQDASTFKHFATLALNTKTGLSAQMKQWKADMDADSKAMSKDRSMIAGGAAMIVTGVMICVIAVALIPETGGTSAAVVGAIGVGAVGGGATMIGLAEHDLDKKETDYAQKFKEWSEGNSEKLSLITINTTSNNIATHASDIGGALNTIMHSWQQMDNDLTDIIGVLNTPEHELMEWIKKRMNDPQKLPSYNVMAIILDAAFKAPQKDWAKAAKTAQQLLNGISRVVEFTLPAGTVPTRANIIKHAPQTV